MVKENEATKEVFLTRFDILLDKLVPKMVSVIHEHELKKLTLKEIRATTGSYAEVFYCDARKFYDCYSEESITES